MRLLLAIGLERGYRLLQKLIDSKLASVAYAAILKEDPHEQPWSEQIAALAQAHHIPCTVTRSLSSASWRELVEAHGPDALFVMGWRTLIDETAIAAIPHGALIAHDSLLPDLRGFAPVSWGILLGRKHFGITLFRIGSGVDDGPILGQIQVDVGPRPRVEEVTRKIAAVAPDLFMNYLRDSQGRIPTGLPQVESVASYGPKRTPSDSEIDWSQSAVDVDRLVRAVPPPGAFTWLGGEKLTILDGEPKPDPHPFAARIVGAVLSVDRSSGHVTVGTGNEVFVISRLRVGAGEVPPSSVLRSITMRLGREALRSPSVPVHPHHKSDASE